jgi:hypothetical protein
MQLSFQGRYFNGKENSSDNLFQKIPSFTWDCKWAMTLALVVPIENRHLYCWAYFLWLTYLKNKTQNSESEGILLCEGQITKIILIVFLLKVSIPKVLL